jgi:hypothetical protein
VELLRHSLYSSISLGQRKERIDDGECVAGRQNMRPLEYGKIEQMVKKFSTHRCALDFDQGFINGILKEIKE